MTTNELKAYIKSCVKELQGVNTAQAFHNLIEADHAVVPFLIEEFHIQKDPIVRSRIVEIIWQHRLPTQVKFLADALEDKEEVVWKSALDGLVTIGGDKALEILETAKQRFEDDQLEERTRVEWIEEAIGQIR